MRARPETTQRIILAIERIAAAGREPTMRTVRARLMRDSKTERGASFEQILPVLRRWQSDTLERARVRIEAAVDSIVSLRSKLERDEVRRLVEARTGGGIRCRFVVRGKPRKPAREGSVVMELLTPPTARRS